jgi:hypothetical protein
MGHIAMVYSVSRWAKSQVERLERSIMMMQDGTKTTFEIRDGKKIDTTAETLDEESKLLDHIQMLLLKD